MPQKTQADCNKRLTAAKVSEKFNSTFFAADGNKTGLHQKSLPLTREVILFKTKSETEKEKAEN